jgi:hypothetical protein
VRAFGSDRKVLHVGGQNEGLNRFAIKCIHLIQS